MAADTVRMDKVGVFDFQLIENIETVGKIVNFQTIDVGLFYSFFEIVNFVFSHSLLLCLNLFSLVLHFHSILLIP